jgi:hypothetical protein
MKRLQLLIAELHAMNWNETYQFGKYVKQLCVHEFAAGLYHLQVQPKKTQHIVKLMVE